MFFRVFLLLLCFNFFYSTPNINTCFASFNYQEGVWISLDLPPAQRKKIDNIIVSEHTQIAKLSQPSSIFSLTDANEIYTVLNYMNQIQNIQSNVSDKIMLTLTPDQQLLFSDQLDKNQSAASESFLSFLTLDLSESQQLLVANSLLNTQRKVWNIIANTDLSWEERRAKLAHLNAVGQIRSILIANKLSSTQLAALNKWAKLSLL